MFEKFAVKLLLHHCMYNDTIKKPCEMIGLAEMQLDLYPLRFITNVMQAGNTSSIKTLYEELFLCICRSISVCACVST